jgi:redox-sensitive bicupin YhaK (pirin superfamily)
MQPEEEAMTIRTLQQISRSIPTMEGAGVHLRRAFGFGGTALFDPFLLFDDFRSDRPDEYLKGFPWHPHRGIETITYVLAGNVEHGDSLGNRGTITSGDVQWMTAGSGIIHQEMPKGDDAGSMHGFQLWCNLPSAEKMCLPRYRDVTAATIPTMTTATGAKVKVICGQVDGVRGPVEDITIDPQYLDITVPAESGFEHPTRPGDTVIAYVIGGEASFAPAETDRQGNCSILVFSDGDRIAVRTAAQPVRFLLISGRPLREPIAWRGPIVMNTEAELQTAFREYHDGTFLKHH